MKAAFPSLNIEGQGRAGVKILTTLWRGMNPSQERHNTSLAQGKLLSKQEGYLKDKGQWEMESVWDEHVLQTDSEILHGNKCLIGYQE